MEEFRINVTPTSADDWNHHLNIYRGMLKKLNYGDTDTGPTLQFYIPKFIQQLLLLFHLGNDFLILLRLLSDLYASKMRKGEVAVGWLSNLDLQANIVADLTKHLRKTIKTSVLKPVVANIDEAVRCIMQDVEELLQYPTHPTEEMEIAGGLFESPYETYFLACTVHPKIDLDGKNLIWLKGLFRQQPKYIDADKIADHTEHLDAEERLPALVLLLRASLMSEGEEFIYVFKVFGAWSVKVAKDLWTVSNQGNEDAFVKGVTEELASILSPIPLHIRTTMCNISLRGTYRSMVDYANKLLDSDYDLERIDVLCHRMFRWVLVCAMSSDLMPEEKNRISNWTQRCGFDKVLVSNYPIGVTLPGQEALNWLLGAWDSTATNIESDQELDEEGEDLEDVEFEPTGPLLHPLHYATHHTEKYTEEVCNICQDDLWDGYEQELKIDTCGHLVHEDCLSWLINGIENWSNKCPACRQQICRQRERRALIDEDDDIDPAQEDEQTEYEEADGIKGDEEQRIYGYVTEGSVTMRR